MFFFFACPLSSKPNDKKRQNNGFISHRGIIIMFLFLIEWANNDHHCRLYYLAIIFIEYTWKIQRNFSVTVHRRLVRLIYNINDSQPYRKIWTRANRYMAQLSCPLFVVFFTQWKKSQFVFGWVGSLLRRIRRIQAMSSLLYAHQS